MHTSSVLVTLALTALTTARYTQAGAEGISEIPEGQTQGASSTLSSEDFSTFSSFPYTNGFTSFTTETNSDGVITGMPSVVTSQPTQPVLVTSQPSISYPAGWNGTSTSNSTSTSGVASGPSGSGFDSFTASTESSSGPSTGSASAGSATSTGGAVATQVAGPGAALFFAGSLFSIFL